MSPLRVYLPSKEVQAPALGKSHYASKNIQGEVMSQVYRKYGIGDGDPFQIRRERS